MILILLAILGGAVVMAGSVFTFVFVALCAWDYCKPHRINIRQGMKPGFLRFVMEKLDE